MKSRHPSSTVFRSFSGLVMLAALMLAALPAARSLAAPTPGKTRQLNSPDETPEGLSKSDWTSIRAAYEAGRHAFMPIEGGWQAFNPGQQWTAKFDGRGFLATPREGDWIWGLELSNYGFGKQQTSVRVRAPRVKAEGQRLTYQWDANVQEWWVNDQRGLEHGYVVRERPQDEAGSGVNFVLRTRGNLTPKVSEDALGVVFQDASGTAVLNYTGLKAWDADGKILPTRFDTVENWARESVCANIEDTDIATASWRREDFAPCLRLLVDDRGARYPIMIDPIAQQAYLKSNQGTADDRFGVSVAVSGDTAVVGAYLEDSSTTGVNSTPDESASNAGAAYVFVRSGTNWSQQAYLKAHQVSTDDHFGGSVAVSGDTVVVGARFEDSSTTAVNSTPNESGTDAGAAYVFVRSGTNWSQQAYLKAHQVTLNDQFGGSVAADGDTVVIGAIGEDSSSTGVNSTANESASYAGAAYVFVRSGTTWSQQAYLKAHQVTLSDYFGGSVAVSGDTVVVGAYGEDSSTTDVNSTPNESASGAGAAYVFVRNGTIWSQQAYLKAHQVSGG